MIQPDDIESYYVTYNFGTQMTVSEIEYHHTAFRGPDVIGIAIDDIVYHWAILAPWTIKDFFDEDGEEWGMFNGNYQITKIKSSL